VREGGDGDAVELVAVAELLLLIHIEVAQHVHATRIPISTSGLHDRALVSGLASTASARCSGHGRTACMVPC
jgi:hypothetical protein